MDKTEGKRIVNLVLLALAIIVLIVYAYYNLSDKPEILVLATTTSTYDSGLLDDILPDFEGRYNATVKVISVGTGQAIRNGERGDVDIILVHAPDAEKEFVDAGYGSERHCIMYNDFVLLGKDDPAEIKGLPVKDALRAIMDSGSTFVSRGDDSGTHKKELKLWGELIPQGEWYKEAGAGMGVTLRIANDMDAYVLADRGTSVALKDKHELIVLVEGDDELLNPYGMIAVNPELHDVNNALAESFIAWMLSDEVQDMIEGYERHGEQLFTPLRGECMED